MASRVNVRFVIFLAIGLIVLAGGVMVAGVYALRKSGAEYAAIGDKMVQQAAGEVDKEKKQKAYEQAALQYSHAVYREKTSPEYCRKWRDALEKITPTPQQAYIDRFKGDYTAAWVGLRNAAPQDVAVQREFLEWTLDRTKKFASPTDSESWRALAEEAKDAIERFDDPATAAVLNRYIGIANVAIIRLQGAGQTQTLIEPTKAALDAAIKADPSDSESVNARASLTVLEANELRGKDPVLADKMAQEAHDRLTEFLKQHPDSTRIRLTLLQLEMNQAVIAAKNSLTWGQLYINFHDKLEALMDAVRKEKPEQFDTDTAIATASAAMSSPRLEAAGASAFLDDLLKVHPTNPSLLLAKGRAAMRAGKPDEAMKAYQTLADIPEVPLSLEGVFLFGQRAEAMVQQVTAKLGEIKEGMNAAERAKVVEEARKFRERLVAYIGENETALLLLDARLLLSEDKVQAARIKLDEYNQKTDNKSIEGLTLLGDILSATGNQSGAKQQYENVLKRDGSNTLILLRLVNVEQTMQNYAAAVARCDQILELQPNNEPVKNLRASLESIRQAGDSPNPLDRILAQANIAGGGVNRDFPKAISILREGITKNLPQIEKDKDARLHRALVLVLNAANDRAGATTAANDALKLFPNDAQLKSFAQDLSEADPLAATIARINSNNSIDELGKCIARALAYRRFGKADEAKAEIAKAAAINPNAPGVLELQFGEALRDNKPDEARRLAEAATKINADNVNGLTFRARLEMFESRFSEAATTLEETLTKDRLNPAAWRLLGAVRAQLSQLDQAGKAYEKALEIKADDIESIVGLLRVKMGQRSFADALTFAREKQAFAGGDPDFVDLWLMAESVAPAGDKSRAIEVRKNLRARVADNEQNNFALAVLLIDARKWDEARTLIDELRSKNKDNVKYLEVDAHWSLAQGNARAATDKFNEYISAIPPAKHNEDPYLSLASLLVRYGQTKAALNALEDGVKHQDPKTMRADRELGEAYFSLGQFDKAIETFNKIAASKPSDLRNVDNRILASMIRAGRLREAKAKLDALGETAVAADANLLILRGDVLAGLGDRENALKAYDQAIAVEKGNSFAFVKRGDFLMGDPAREKDAEDDLKQAILIDQRSYAARQRLAVLHTRRDRFEDAIKVLKEGIAIDPDNSLMRQDVIDVYLMAKQPEKVVIEVEQALQRAPNDSSWLLRARELMARLEKWDAATDYGARLWEKNKVAVTTYGYLDAMLKTSNPDLTKALTILSTPELNTAKDGRLLMLRVRIQLKRGKITEATQDLATSLSLVDPTDPGSVGQFFLGLATIYPQPKDQMAALKALEPKGGYRSWFSVWLNKLKADTPETSAEGLAALKLIGESKEANDVRAAAYAAIGSKLHADKKNEEALAAWRSGLLADPNDAELNNNVAFTLGTLLNRAPEAIPYAEKAAVSLPNNSSVLDTLGAVHLALKNYDKAEASLVQAQAYAQGEGERAAIYIHMAQLRAAQGNKVEAKKFLQFVSELMRQFDDVRKRFAEDFEKTKLLVDAAG